jgi:uncharacterized protein YbjT (DUF2867 family)
MILVVGATGPLGLGREIARSLLDRGYDVRTLVRPTSDPEIVSLLKEWGAETLEGDVKEPASLVAACEGVGAVFTTVTSVMSHQPDDSIEATDLRGQEHLIDAALDAGVERFVYTSYSGRLATPVPLSEAKRTVERHLEQSGLTYTILRPTYFMQTWLSPAVGFDPANAKARVFGTGTEPVSWISMPDVAAFAVHAFEDPQMQDRVLELGGPEMLTPLEVVAIFEELSGRSFEVEHVPEEVLREQARALADPVERSFAGLMADLARGDPIPMDDLLERFPMSMTTVRDHAAQVTAG